MMTSLRNTVAIAAIAAASFTAPLHAQQALESETASSVTEAAKAVEVDTILAHIQTGFGELALASEKLAQTAQHTCDAPGDSQTVARLTAFHDAFDAWVRVSHLRFGPTEAENRAFALAFWPDPRSKTPKAIARLIREQDPAAYDLQSFASVSIAARGFYALEYLLFDEAQSDETAYHCALIKTLAADISQTTEAISADWETYADLMRRGAANDTYRSDTEVLQKLFTTLVTGLEFTADARLGRPLGSFERPRPNRAEARRSERSLRHIELSLSGMRPLAKALSGNDEGLDAKFERALRLANELNDPRFEGVSEPQSRLKVEILQQSVKAIRTYLIETTGPRLGIAAGFNAMDGD